MADAIQRMRTTVAVQPKVQQEESDVEPTRDAEARRPAASEEDAAASTEDAPAIASSAYVADEQIETVCGPIEIALDAEAEGNPEPAQRMASQTEPSATEWEEPDPPGQQHYITTVCEGAPDDGSGRCPKCHLAIDLGGLEEGETADPHKVIGLQDTTIEILRATVDELKNAKIGLQRVLADEERDAMHSGGILSDVCDIAFDDEGRAMTAGYDGIRERVRELVQLERRLIESPEGSGDEATEDQVGVLQGQGGEVPLAHEEGGEQLDPRR